MPTASIDLFLASSAMILVVMGAIYGVNTVVEPYLDASDTPLERYQQIMRFMLLSPGKPEDWGAASVPTALGFASNGGIYALDIDKVTRLNPLNTYALDYSQLWEANGIGDISFRIRVDTLFNLSLSLVSSQNQGENTTYAFAASTTRWGYPLPTDVSYYIAIRGFTASRTGTTDIDGSGTVEFTLPNSLNGSALLVGLARVEPSLVSYGVLPFTHNAPPEPAGTFVTLSPLNYTLTVDLAEGATVINAAVFSLDYVFNLTGSGVSYEIPRLLDPSPMVLVVTGVIGSDYWAEWTAYPQLPIDTGAEMSDAYAISDVASSSYLVEVKGALYRFEVSFRSPVEG